MKAASLSDIKKELGHLDQANLQALCLRLARYKKDNKELLTYLIFESYDEVGFVTSVKNEMDELFDALPKSNIYLMKKSLRKILRIVNKQIRYSEVKQTELELRIYFCGKAKKANIHLLPSQVLSNLYHQQRKKIDAVLSKLPEDLQYDYAREIELLK
jgi:hypothetical protein